MTLDLLHRVVEGHSLDETQAEEAMRAVLAGESTPILMASFLTALRIKGETVEELAGFARAMRAAALPLPIAESARPLLDTCGTGGTVGISAFNISTVAAFVVAGAGVRVAKHGNRSITSKCGSADVLEALGVATRVSPETVTRAIEEIGIGFLFAPFFHVATRHAQPVRLELKFRTFFNYLGPLTNPAQAEFQVAGTWSDEAAEKIAGALARLGTRLRVRCTRVRWARRSYGDWAFNGFPRRIGRGGAIHTRTGRFRSRNERTGGDCGRRRQRTIGTLRKRCWPG